MSADDDGFGIRPDDLERTGGSAPDPCGSAHGVGGGSGAARPIDAAGVRAAADAKADRPLKAVSIERIQAAIAAALSGLAGRGYAVSVERIDFDPRGVGAGGDHQLLTIGVSTTKAAGTPDT